MSAYRIRTYGDPVLRQRAAEVSDIDSSVVGLVEQMFPLMYDAPGIGLAATQVGVGRRLFVYDVGDDPRVLVNPVITETRGEWEFDEGCLSIPGVSLHIVRPKEVHITGFDLHGNEVSIEADELLARLFQHELDHLDGVVMLDRCDADERKRALRELREMALSPDALS
jgi:peptide deformylase